MPWLLEQLKPFVLTLLVGLIAGLVFQFYQCSTALSGCGRWLLYLLDFLVWLIILLLVLALLLLINQGEIRVYILLALFTGIFIYFRTIAPAIRPYMCRIARTNGRLIRAAGYQVAVPLRWMWKKVLLLHEKWIESRSSRQE